MKSALIFCVLKYTHLLQIPNLSRTLKTHTSHTPTSLNFPLAICTKPNWTKLIPNMGSCSKQKRSGSWVCSQHFHQYELFTPTKQVRDCQIATHTGSLNRVFQGETTSWSHLTAPFLRNVKKMYEQMTGIPPVQHTYATCLKAAGGRGEPNPN